MELCRDRRRHRFLRLAANHDSADDQDILGFASLGLGGGGSILAVLDRE
jgi:hypothetical protein